MYVILTISDHPLIDYAEHITSPDVKKIHFWRERIREWIRAEPKRPLRLSVIPALFQRFASLEGTPGLTVVRDA
jgi:hypothetical protein